MPEYRVFLSYGSTDQTLAYELKSRLESAFPGAIRLFLSSADILPGEQWKESIKKGVRECDALLLLLSPRYVKRPWAYIEWAPFWIEGRKTYIVNTSDVDVQELVSPMRDTQLAHLFNESDVRKLLLAMAKDMAALKGYSGTVPDEHARLIAQRTEELFQNQKEENAKARFGIYRGQPENLPIDDGKKKEIFWYFRDRERDADTAREVFQRIQDNALKGEVLFALVEKGDYALIEQLYEFVENKVNLLPMLKALVAAGKADSGLMRKLLEDIASSQTTLRALAEAGLKDQGSESRILALAVPHFQNMAELRKVGERLVDNGYARTAAFDQVVAHMTGRNNAEWRKLLVYLLSTDKYDRNELLEQVIKLAKQNQKEAEKVLVELWPRDPEAVNAVMAMPGVITVEEVRKRVQDMVDGGGSSV